jgi:hypothetical protein
MATYYLRTSANGGSDAAAGSLAAPWATFGKALGTTGISSGDTLIVAGGTYRETITITMVSATAETIIRADYDNLLGDGADVRLSAYTTNDTTAPANATTITLNGRDFLTFDGITVIGGNVGNTCVVGAVTSTDIKFIRCAFISSRTTSAGNLLSISAAANTALNWVIDSCFFMWSNNNAGLVFTLNRPTGADFDYNVQIRNCLAFGPSGAFVRIDSSGANTFNGGGVDMVNCGFIGNSAMMQTGSANISTSIPCTAYRNWHIGGTAGSFIASAAGGQIVEDYNRVFNGTANANVTAGANTIAGNVHAFLLNFGQDMFFSDAKRPFGTPLAGSPLLGQGGSGGTLALDMLDRPRPAGGLGLGWGPLERHDTARKGATLGADAGTGYLEIVGPGDQDILIPVDAVATTITVRVKWDSNHGDTAKPQARILNGGEVGWTNETIVATGTAGGAYETLTFTTRTPSKAGVITLRLQSFAGAANGIAAFDTLTVV